MIVMLDDKGINPKTASGMPIHTSKKFEKMGKKAWVNCSWRGHQFILFRATVLKKLIEEMLFSISRYIRKHFNLWRNFKILDYFQPKILNSLADFNVHHGPYKVRMGNLGMGLG